jgi:hypothetical protein
MIHDIADDCEEYAYILVSPAAEKPILVYIDDDKDEDGIYTITHRFEEYSFPKKC